MPTMSDNLLLVQKWQCRLETFDCRPGMVKSRLMADLAPVVHEAGIIQHLIGTGLPGVAAGIVLADGSIICCNAGLMRMLESPAEEIIGKNLSDLFPEEEGARAMEEFRRHFEKANHAAENLFGRPQSSYHRVPTSTVL